MLVVIDLEATCIEPRDPKFISEIIEIGAVKVDLPSRKIVDRYQSFIQPQVHKELTPFCKELTTITQEQVDRAHRFNTVYNNFIKWFGNPDKNLLCSWGFYDRRALEKDCMIWDMDWHLGNDHWNLKKFYLEMTGQKKIGLDGALKQLGLEFEGTPHRADSDAHNTARVLLELLKR